VATAIPVGSRATPSADTTLQIGLLGPLLLVRDGRHVELTGPKRGALLTLLALHVGAPVNRQHLVEALWGDQRTGREAATLRVHVSHLRDVIEPVRGGPPRVLVTVGSAYLLSAEHVDVDVARFDRLATEARRLLPTEPGRALEHLTAARELWRGRPLQDVEYQEFAQVEIRRLELARQEVVADHAEALIAVGKDAASLDDLEALARSDPMQERPAALLMRALYRTGRQADALRVSRRHARHLREEGLDPSPRICQLEQRILRHDPDLLSERTSASGDVGPGSSVRGYELREAVGTGPVGTVYRAFQASVGREVAVKAIHAGLAATPGFVRRFAEEARVVASLEHPHIVPIHDFWREPAGAFLVLRWMDGDDLAQQLGRPWDPSRIGRVFGQLADALAHAHDAGVIHGNLKLSNILFDAAGNAYLSDFGLAVTRIGSGGSHGREGTLTAALPHASPERRRGDVTVASDIFALGMLLHQAAAGPGGDGSDRSSSGVAEVIDVATAARPVDRYPDVMAFASALLDAVGARQQQRPRRVRRNPYKGLAAFAEVDRSDFCGRDDVVESVLGLVGEKGLTAVVGASGSGKSSVVMAGLVPQLRAGALPGSEDWVIVSTVPGTDPFEEFHLALRSVAVGHQRPDDAGSRELRHGFAAAMDDPTGRALLIVDQFEELFSSRVGEDVRERFLDDLVDLALDPARRVRVVVTLRADFSDRPLLHPQLGDLVSAGSLLLGPMRSEQVEEAIRRPAGRVGVHIEPGLVGELVRDVMSAPASLPLLQYVLSELFEGRGEDRLTVQAYRALGGVQAVLERRAESTYASLPTGARPVCRQIFLRMVNLGEHGEESRRRLPLTELHGLGARADVDAVLDAFAGARLLTYDRDPVTRTPTIEVAHETVIHRWARYRVWIDDARAALRAHGRLSTAAAMWADADEDPSYLLTGGPLAAAIETGSGERLDLNALESRFLAESRRAADLAREQEETRRQQQSALARRARRRLEVGIATAVIAGLVALIATYALIERRRADDLAAAQERQNLARELASASSVNLTSADPDLSLLLALAAADLSLAVEEDVLPEAVDALHRAVINPRAREVTRDGRGELRGQSLAYAPKGTWFVVLADDGGVLVLDPIDGAELGRIPPLDVPAIGLDVPAIGLDVHPSDGRTVLVRYRDGVRQWDWRSGVAQPRLAAPPDGTTVTTAAYAPDGSTIAVGRDDGLVQVWQADGSGHTELREHTGTVVSVDFDPTGSRLVTGGADRRALVWDLDAGAVTTEANLDRILLPLVQLAWHPVDDVVAVATTQGDNLLFDAVTGERLNSFGNAQNTSHSIAFDPTGIVVITADGDGFVRVYGTWVGGEAWVVVPAGGVPLRDAAIDPIAGGAASVGVDGQVRLGGALHGSELPARESLNLYPQIVAARDGSRYVLAAHGLKHGLAGAVPTMEVVDAATGRTLLHRPTVADWGTRLPAITGDGSTVAFAGPDGDVQILEVESGASITIDRSAVQAAGLAFSPDGALLAGGGIDGTIAIWDRGTGTAISLLTGHGDRRPRISSIPHERDRGRSDGRLEDDLAWEMAVNAATSRRVNQVAFHPDGSTLASAGFDGTVRTWVLETGEDRVLQHFDHEVFTVAYTPDGTVLAAADRAGTILLLDAESGEVIRTPDPAPGPTNLVISPEGTSMAGAVFHPVAYLWDLESGRTVRRIHGAVYRLTSVAFLNGGSELRTASGEAIDRGCLLDPADLIDLAREQVRRELTDAECEQYLRRPCSD
jgi:WD40 repeat protein/serine/threonine protein kinase/DNA-binding SARP family transcriptional activator